MAGHEAVGPEEGGAAEPAAVVGPPHPLLGPVFILAAQPMHALKVSCTQRNLLIFLRRNSTVRYGTVPTA
jgi:hypothetical protein